MRIEFVTRETPQEESHCRELRYGTDKIPRPPFRLPPSQSHQLWIYGLCVIPTELREGATLQQKLKLGRGLDNYRFTVIDHLHVALMQRCCVFCMV